MIDYITIRVKEEIFIQSINKLGLDIYDYDSSKMRRWKLSDIKDTNFVIDTETMFFIAYLGFTFKATRSLNNVFIQINPSHYQSKEMFIDYVAEFGVSGNEKITRIDIAVDVLEIPVSKFLKNTIMKYVRKSKLITSGNKTQIHLTDNVETFYHGKINLIRCYNKSLERYEKEGIKTYLNDKECLVTRFEIQIRRPERLKKKEEITFFEIMEMIELNYNFFEKINIQFIEVMQNLDKYKQAFVDTYGIQALKKSYSKHPERFRELVEKTNIDLQEIFRIEFLKWSKGIYHKIYKEKKVKIKVRLLDIEKIALYLMYKKVYIYDNIRIQTFEINYKNFDQIMVRLEDYRLIKYSNSSGDVVLSELGLRYVKEKIIEEKRNQYVIEWCNEILEKDNNLKIL